MAGNFELSGTAGAQLASEKWRRTRLGTNENVGGEILVSDFASVMENGVIPSGVAVSYDADAELYKPYQAAQSSSNSDTTQGAVLAGFLADVGGVFPGTADKVTVAVAVRETIVSKYLPRTADRSIDEKTPTSGVFVFIKE